jgi:aminocarboxymuconate-semialdehyde decarboxylase
VSQPVTDVHTHLVPDLAGIGGVEGVVVAPDGRLEIDGTSLALPGLYDAGRLESSLASHGIDAAWVSAPPPTYRQGMGPGATERWVRVLDSGMRARILGHASLGLLTYLPLDQPAIALTLARELAPDQGTIGWSGSAGGASVPLDDDACEPLWKLLEETGRPLLLHPGDSPDPRLDPLYLANLLGNPVETGIAAAQLLLGGVLTRHPGLKVVLVHCGGIVPALVGRWARGVTTQRPGIPRGTADPTESVKSLWVDTLAHSRAVVDLAIEVLGPDRLVLGSDYPFPMGIDDAFESIAHLDRALRDQIGRTAAHLLPGSGK